MVSPLSGPAELAVVRGFGAAAVLCERGVPEPFAGAFPGSVHDRAGLLKALRSNTAGTTVVIRASSSELAAELLDEVGWQSGHLFLVGTGDAEARIRAESVPWLSWVRVRYVDLEFVPPRIVESGPGHARLTGGLGLVELSGTSSSTAPRRAPELPVARLLPGLESALLPPRIAAQQLAEESERRLVAERVIDDLKASVSWRATAPLRGIKRVLQSGRHT